MRLIPILVIICVIAVPIDVTGFQPATGVVAILPVQDRAGDREIAVGIDQAIRTGIAARWESLDSVTTRDTLRSLRIRNGDLTPQARMQRLASDLGADWLVSFTVHDADRQGLPRLTLSGRAYDGNTGEMIWAGFEGGSGSDSNKILGLGQVWAIEDLSPRIVDRLLEGLHEAVSSDWRGSLKDPARQAAARLGSVAIIPFASITSGRATENAGSVTEATRAAIFQLGLPVVAPGCTNEVLRRTRGDWGGVDTTTRLKLQQECGADSIITGSVEKYESGSTVQEPNPEVSMGMRLIDANSGRILWTEGLERTGFDSQSILRFGRVHSAGDLTERMIEKLTKRMAKDLAQRPLSSVEE